MAKTSIVVGVLLIILGIGFFVCTGSSQLTALIPAFIGILILICGMLAARESWRRHAMHGAAVLGVIGALGGLGMGLPKWIKGDMERPLAVYEQLIMGVICLIFVILCIRSFIEARKARGT